MEDEIRKLEQRMTEIKNEKDSVQQEMENVKVQLHLAEDKSDNLNDQLHETLRKLKEGNYLFYSTSSTANNFNL